MIHHWTITGLGVLVLLSGIGCSAFIAESKKPDEKRLQHVAQLRLYTPRATVLARLGQPERTHVNAEGQRIDEYTIKQGDPNALGRVEGHVVLSAVTLGAWEIIGIPMELAQAQGSAPLHLRLTYDPQELLFSIQTAP